MATLLNLKQRISAAKNVSKTTKALQMISASKLKKAQDAVMAARPYVEKVSELTALIKRNMTEEYTHPYLETKTKSNKTLLIALAPDKGLCGSLLTNIIREFARYHKQEHHTSYIIIGKKLETRVLSFSREIIASFDFGTTLPNFDNVIPLIKIINDYYLSGKVNSVKILTTEYTNVFTQKPKVKTILPIQLPENNEEDHSFDTYLIEPNRKDLLDALLNHYLEMAVYEQLLESFVSEQAARMISMQNATDNANDIIEDLFLEYNKTRQSKITSELLDITGGKSVAKAA